MIELMLPDATIVVLPLNRLTRLYDGLEQLEDMWGDEASQSEDSLQDGETEEFWADDRGGSSTAGHRCSSG